MKKPIIGVLPLFDLEKDSYWMLPAYFQGLINAGALPVMLPLEVGEDSERLVELCDGVLFTGGHDVDPALYGEAVMECCSQLCPARDRLEPAVLRAAMKKNIPILGICRGLQLINAALGGTLWQDLPTQRPESRNHRMERPYDRAEHFVTLSGPLAEAYGADSLGVNSCHHQGIKALAPGLEPMAVAEDGLIEAVWDPKQPFLWAVQWHPEFSWRTDPNSIKIFRAFVEAMK